MFSFLDRGNGSPPAQVGSSSSSNNNAGSFSFLFKDSAQPSTTFTPSQSESSSVNTSGSFPFHTESPPNKNIRIGTNQPSAQSSLFGVSSLTPAKRPSSDIESSADQPLTSREQAGAIEKDFNSSLLKSPPSLQPLSKKIKQSPLQPESFANKENVKPLSDEGSAQTGGTSLPFSPKKFSLSTASPIKASPQKSNSAEFSTPKKPLQPVNSNRMTPPPSFQLMKSPATSSMQQTTTKANPSTTHVNTPRPPLNVNHQLTSSTLLPRVEEDNLQQSFERTERFISKHRSDLDEMKEVEQQLEGVKRKDTELCKTMDEINTKMNEHSDTLKTLTLRVTLLTNKMLMTQCPIINEKVEQIHSKYAHLINKTL